MTRRASLAATQSEKNKYIWKFPLTYRIYSGSNVFDFMSYYAILWRIHVGFFSKWNKISLVNVPNSPLPWELAPKANSIRHGGNAKLQKPSHLTVEAALGYIFHQNESILPKNRSKSWNLLPYFVFQSVVRKSVRQVSEIHHFLGQTKLLRPSSFAVCLAYLHVCACVAEWISLRNYITIKYAVT